MKAARKANTAGKIIALAGLLVGVTPDLHTQWIKPDSSLATLTDPVDLKLQYHTVEIAHEDAELPLFRTFGNFRYRAFFCVMEERITQKSGVPFRFRLGSVPYVDMLESKAGNSASR